jgi:protein translocase SecG subunit
LVVSVLLQPGKTDAGALFTSNISSSAFQPRGATTILSKISIGSAVVFMISALMLSMPALTGTGSILNTAGDVPVEETVPAMGDNANIDMSTNPGVKETPAPAIGETVATNNDVNNVPGNADDANKANDANVVNANK